MKSIDSIKKDIQLKNPGKVGWYAAIDTRTGDFKLGKTLVNSYKNAKESFGVDKFSFYKIGIDPIASYNLN
ncbi:MAG: hypothetical protein J0M18_13180 [Ignavibacteria bacterium]|nr:hypothetical protein [Ignavibacteria bacterium]